MAQQVAVLPGLSRKKHFCFAAASMLFGTLAVMGLCELSLRVFAPGWLVHSMRSLSLAANAEEFGSDVGWSVESAWGKFIRFTPNTRFKVEYTEYNHWVNIDSMGNRATPGPAKQPGLPAVPFLGDSFLFGLGVNDDQTYISLLNRSSRCRYLNLGVPGSALPNDLEIIQFRNRELQDPPVYVFNVFLGNDFGDIIRYYTIDKGTRFKESQSHRVNGLLAYLDRHIYHNRLLARSYLLQFIRLEFLTTRPHEEQFKSRYGGLKTRWIEDPLCLMMTGNKNFINDARKYTEIAMDRLAKLSHDLHFTPIFVIIPDKHQVDPYFVNYLAARYGLDPTKLNKQAPDHIIEREIKEQGYDYVDLFACLRNKTGLYYQNDGHFTVQGHQVVAQCLARDLNPLIDSAVKPRGLRH